MAGIITAENGTPVYADAPIGSETSATATATFGDLLDVTNAARREYPLVAILDGLEYAVSVEITSTDLDVDLDYKAVHEGRAKLRGVSHEGATVVLHLTPIGR